MTETTTRPQGCNGRTGLPGDPHPLRRHISYLTGERSVELGYAALTDIMDEVFDLWDRVEATGTTRVIGDGFEDLIAHIARMREFTGWDGVPGEFTT